MKKTYAICHCGNTVGSHYFRHPFEKTTTVTRVRTKQGEYFCVDASHFPVKQGTRCGAGNCASLPDVHGTITLKHAYVPTQYTYRDVNFTLPDDSICSVPDCATRLSEHKDIMTHIFRTKFRFSNLHDDDRVTIIHPDDEDIKISVEVEKLPS